MAEIFAGIESCSFDLVATNPTHFLVVRRKFPLSGVVATLLNLDSAGKIQRQLSGAIVARDDRPDLNSLMDIRNRRIAAPSLEHMGGYRAQVYELHLAGINLPEDIDSLQLIGVHQEAIRAAFTRSCLTWWATPLSSPRLVPCHPPGDQAESATPEQ